MLSAQPADLLAGSIWARVPPRGAGLFRGKLRITIASLGHSAVETPGLHTSANDMAGLVSAANRAYITTTAITAKKVPGGARVRDPSSTRHSQNFKVSLW